MEWETKFYYKQSQVTSPPFHAGMREREKERERARASERERVREERVRNSERDLLSSACL
jgi:hypothetical protein